MCEDNILNEIRTNINIKFDSVNDAKIIYNSIKPEISYANKDRSKTILKLEKNILSINIISKDMASFRASINSYVRWIKLSEKILKI
ncbi:MAG: KEOPS complex subunit Pcc1 [Methanobacteriaceae archaeon]|nr:KEOPS complex subunit Pcc1 [Methanobacteriaceae archaeon]